MKEEPVVVVRDESVELTKAKSNNTFQKSDQERALSNVDLLTSHSSPTKKEDPVTTKLTPKSSKSSLPQNLGTNLNAASTPIIEHKSDTIQEEFES